MSIILTLLIFGIVVCIHEYGHFIAAKRCGILVEEFAIGMGPIIFKKQGKETLYTLRAFPLGGFCKMLGEEGEDADYDEKNSDRSFYSKTAWQRFIVMVAGATMNFLLGYVVFFIFLCDGFVLPVVDRVMENSPAAEIGLEKGDRIVSINDKKIHSFNDLYLATQENGSNEAEILFVRDSEKHVSKTKLAQNEKTGDFTIGFYPVIRNGIFTSKNSENYVEGMEKATFFETASQTFWFIDYQVRAFLTAIGNIFSGGVDDLSGPVGIATVVGDQYEQTIKVGIGETVRTMAMILASISLSLGFFNLLPLPALDGGKVVFIFLELIRGKRVDPEKENLIHIVGFILLMILGVVVTFKDIFKIINV